MVTDKPLPVAVQPRRSKWGRRAGALLGAACGVRWGLRVACR